MGQRRQRRQPASPGCGQCGHLAQHLPCSLRPGLIECDARRGDSQLASRRLGVDVGGVVRQHDGCCFRHILYFLRADPRHHIPLYGARAVRCRRLEPACFHQRHHSSHLHRPYGPLHRGQRLRLGDCGLERGRQCHVVPDCLRCLRLHAQRQHNRHRCV